MRNCMNVTWSIPRKTKQQIDKMLLDINAQRPKHLPVVTCGKLVSLMVDKHFKDPKERIQELINEKKALGLRMNEIDYQINLQNELIIEVEKKSLQFKGDNIR